MKFNFKEYSYHLDDPKITGGKILSDIGGAMVNGGYAGNRIASLQPDFLTCGVNDFKVIVHDYNILFSLKQADEYYISEALSEGIHPLRYIPDELMPEVFQFTLEDFSNKLNAGLDCILSEATDSELSLKLRLLMDFLQKRLRLRSRFIQKLNEDFEILI